MWNLLSTAPDTVDDLPFTPLELEFSDLGRVEFAEPAAKLAIDHGVVSLTVERFQRGDGRLQSLDNPKHYLVSRDTFDVDKDVASRFTADIWASNIGGDSDDYRDGLAVLSVVDLRSGFVWDIGVTSTHVWAIHELLDLPGLPAQGGGFYRVVDDLYHAPRIAGTTPHHCEIELDARNRRSRWFVDGELIHEAHLSEPPDAVAIGFGFVTLRRVENGKSTSLRGQGMSARFSNICVPGQ